MTAVVLNESITPQGYPHLRKVQSIFESIEQSKQMLALINLSFSISNTGYEGCQTKTASRYFSVMLEVIKAHPVFCSLDKKMINEVVSVLDSLRVLDGKSQQEKGFLLCKKINELRKNESFVFEIGYRPRDGPGHSMLTRFLRQSNDEYTIWIYNAQSRSCQQNGGIVSESKARCIPYIKFENVRWEEVFLSADKSNPNDIFFMSLMLNMYNPGLSESEFASLDEVLKCYSHIQHRRVEPNKIQNPIYISEQKAGNCTIKTIMCLLLDLIGDERSFKKLSIDIRLYSILAHILNLSRFGLLLGCPRNEVNLVEESIRNFLRKLEKNMVKEFINPNDPTVAKVQKILMNKLNEISIQSQNETLLSKPFDASKLIITQQELDKENVQRRDLITTLHTKQLNAEINFKSIPNIDIFPNLGYVPSWSTLRKCISEHLDLLRACCRNERYYCEAAFKVEQTFREFSQLKFYSEDVTQVDNCQEVLKLLFELQEKYNEILFHQINYNIPEVHITSLEILAIGYILAVKADDEFRILENFGIWNDILIEILQYNNLYLIENIGMQKQINDYLRYIKETSPRYKHHIFKFTSYSISETLFHDKGVPEGLLYYSYIKSKKFNNVFLCREKILDKFLDLSIDPDIPHLSYLKLLCLLTNEALSPVKRNSYLSSYGKMIIKNNGLNISLRHSSWNSNSQSETQFLSNPHEVIKGSSLERYSKHPQSSHLPANHLSENELLITNQIALLYEISSKSTINFRMNQLYLNQSQWLVQVTAIIDAITMDITLISDEQNRRVFMYSFMKLILTDSEIQLPLFNYLFENNISFLLEKWNILLSKAKAHYLDGETDASRGIPPFLSIARQYIKMLFMISLPGKIIPDEYLMKLKELLEEIHKIEIRSLKLRFERDLLELGIQIVLAGSTNDVQDLSQMLKMIFYVKPNTAAGSEFEDEQFWRLCKKNIFLFDWNYVSLSEVSKIGNEILKFFDLFQEGKWEKLSHFFKFKGETHEFIIDLRKAEVIDEKSNLICGSLDLETTTDRKRLFKDRRHEMEIVGQTVNFVDPIWGKIKLQDKGRRILREFKGKYLLYLGENQWNKLGLNLSLLLDFAHFMDLDSGNVTAFDLEHANMEFVIQNGVIINTPSYETRCNNWYYSISTQDRKEFFPPADFDSHINYLLNPKDPKQMILNYSRLVNREGKPISFELIYKKGKYHWVYIENTDYKLCNDFHTEMDFFLMTFIPLQKFTKQLEYKLLVPNGQLNVIRGYSKVANIDLPQEEKDGQRRSINIFEYEFYILNHKERKYNVHIRDFEARLYYIHLRLAQKQYLNCLDHIKEITLNENISSSIKIGLPYLFNSAQKLRDFHPNGIVIRLHLYLRLLRIDMEVRSWEREIFLRLYKDYLRSLNDVDYHLLLPIKKEKVLLGILLQKNEIEVQCREALLRSPSKKIQYLINVPSVSAKTLSSLNGYKTQIGYNEPKYESFTTNAVKLISDISLEDCHREAQRLYDCLDNSRDDTTLWYVLYIIAQRVAEIMSYAEKEFWSLFLLTIDEDSAYKIPLQSGSDNEKVCWAGKIFYLYERCFNDNKTLYIEKYIQIVGLMKFEFPQGTFCEIPNEKGHSLKQKKITMINFTEDFVEEVNNLLADRSKDSQMEIAKDIECILLKLSSSAFLRTESKKSAYAAGHVDINKLIRKITRNSHSYYLERRNDYPLNQIVAEELYKLGIKFMFEGTKQFAKFYDPVQHLKLLEFEYYSQMNIREDQARIIMAFLKQSINQEFGFLFQLMMGGGKTSVILSLMTEITSEQTCLSCVLSLPSQMPAIKGSLTKFQKERFCKDVYILEFQMRDLDSLENLRWIRDQLKSAFQRRCTVIMLRSLAQMLELKFLLDLFSIDDIGQKARDRQTMRLEILQDILLIFKTKGVSFFDEVDQNLSLLYQVIVPLGDPVEPNANFAGLIGEIIRILIEDKEYFKLLQNEPTPQDIKEKFFHRIAAKIIDFAPLKLGKDLKMRNAFQRYIKNEIPPQDQIDADSNCDTSSFSQTKKDNIIFLRDLECCSKSANQYSRMIADLRALTRYFVNEILGIVLSRSYNRGYGKSLKKVGEVVPYRAAQTPDTTKFGDSVSAFAYHALTATFGEITLEELSAGSEKIYESALQFARKLDQDIKDTLEGTLYKNLTGIEITEYKIKEKREKALNFINETPQRRLAFASEFFAFYIDEYPELLVSNSLNVVDQFNASAACSGTLWNQYTFHSRFKNKLTDEDIESSIMKKLRQQFKDGDIKIYFAHDRNLDCVIQMIEILCKEGKKLRGLIDAAGFLKDVSINKAASTLMNCLKRCTNGQIKAVLYLHKSTTHEMEQGRPPESFSLIMESDSSPQFLKNTTLDEIMKYHIKVEDIFSIFDEQICFGTDIPACEDSRFLLTIDHLMPKNRFLQATLRARKFDIQQRVDILMTEHCKKYMGTSFQTIEGRLQSNEDILLENFKHQTLIVKIDAVIRNAIMNHLLKQSMGSLELKDIQRFRTFLIENKSANIYQRFGKIKKPRSHGEVLREYADDKIAEYEKIIYSPIKELFETSWQYYNTPKIIGDLTVKVKNDYNLVDEKLENLKIYNHLSSTLLEDLQKSIQEKFSKIDVDENVSSKIKDLHLHINKTLQNSYIDSEKILTDISELKFEEQVKYLLNLEVSNGLKLNFNIDLLMQEVLGLAQVKEAISELKNLSKIFDEDTHQRTPDNSKTEVEMQQERVVEISVEIEVELNQDLITELNSFLEFGGFNERSEDQWNLDIDMDLWSQIEAKCSDISRYLREFSTSFPDNIYFSKNFTMVIERITTVFQFDKRINYILVVPESDSNYKFVYLSLKDAVYFRYLLQNNAIGSKFYLLDNIGAPHITQKCFELHFTKTQALQKAIWFAHLHNCDLDYIESCPFTKDIINGLERHDLETITKFLLFKLRRFHKANLQKLLYSKYFKLSYGSVITKNNGILFSSRRLDMLSKVILPHEVKWLASNEQLDLLPNELANFLDIEQLRKFKIKPELIESLTNVHLIQALSQDQLKYTRVTQMPFIIESQVHLIPSNRRDLLNALSKSELQNYLTDAQLLIIDSMNYYKMKIQVLDRLLNLIVPNDTKSIDKAIAVRLAICDSEFIEDTQKNMNRARFASFFMDLDPKIINSLSEEDLTKLFAYFPYLIKKLINKKLGNLSYDIFTLEVLSNLEKHQIPHLQSGQISKFDLNQCRILFENLTPEQIKYIQPLVISNLITLKRYRTILCLTNDQMFALDKKLVPSLLCCFSIDDQLKNKSHLQIISSKIDLHLLSPDELNNIFQLIDTEQIRKLTNEEIKLLRTPENVVHFLNSCDKSQSNQLSEAQIKLIPTKSSKLLNDLGEQWMYAAMTDEQLFCIETENFNKLDMPTVNRLSKIYDHSPDKSNISQSIIIKLLICKDENGKKSPNTELIRKFQDYFQRLDQTNINCLSEWQFKLFFTVCPGFIQKVPTSMLTRFEPAFFTFESLDMMNSDQINALSWNQISHLDERSFDLIFDYLNDECLRQLSQKTLRNVIKPQRYSYLLKLSQFQLLEMDPKTLIDFVKVYPCSELIKHKTLIWSICKIKEVVTSLKPEIVRLIEDGELLVYFLENCTADQRKNISPKQVRMIPARAKKMINEFATKEYMSQMSEEQLLMIETRYYTEMLTQTLNTLNGKLNDRQNNSDIDEEILNKKLEVKLLLFERGFDKDPEFAQAVTVEREFFTNLPIQTLSSLTKEKLLKLFLFYPELIKRLTPSKLNQFPTNFFTPEILGSLTLEQVHSLGPLIEKFNVKQYDAVIDFMKPDQIKRIHPDMFVKLITQERYMLLTKVDRNIFRTVKLNNNIQILMQFTHEELKKYRDQLAFIIKDINITKIPPTEINKIYNVLTLDQLKNLTNNQIMELTEENLRQFKRSVNKPSHSPSPFQRKSKGNQQNFFSNQEKIPQIMPLANNQSYLDKIQEKNCHIVDFESQQNVLDNQKRNLVITPPVRDPTQNIKQNGDPFVTPEKSIKQSATEKISPEKILNNRDRGRQKTQENLSGPRDQPNNPSEEEKIEIKPISPFRTILKIKPSSTLQNRAATPLQKRLHLNTKVVQLRSQTPDPEHNNGNEEKYKAQLKLLNQMGFINKDLNSRLLIAGDGNIERAIDALTYLA